MTILSAFRDGVRRVTRAPAVLFGVFALTFLVALPLGLVLAGMIVESLGHSEAGAAAAAGVNYGWWQEFSAQATGVGEAFTPRTIGFGGVLDNAASALDNTGHPLVVAGAGAAYLLAWLFVAGGVIDRYARNRRVRTAAFFATSGVFFFRFLRLGAMALAVYAALYAWVHGWLFDGLYGWATRDLAVERTAFVVRVALYLVFGTLLAAVNLVFDYAKIRAVVEDRRSMVGALAAAVRFVRRWPREAAGLYLLDGALFVALLAAYGLVAPGAGGSGWSLWLGLLLTQVYLLVRIWVKLVFFASEVSLFQASLAHAGYAAAPLAAWPDSPAAEAIGPPAPPPPVEP
jgi:hypothetical protein